MKMIKRIGLIFLALLMLIALVVGTPVGTQLVVGAANLVPGLSIQDAQGRLNRNLLLQQIHYQGIAGINIELEWLSLDWRPSCLFSKAVCVERLQLSGVVFELDTEQLSTGSEESTEPQSGSTPSEPFTLPWQIRAKHIELSRVRVRVNQMHYALGQSSLSAQFKGDTLTLGSLIGEQIAVYIPASDEQDTEAEPSSAAPQTSDWAMATMPKVSLPFAINAPNIALRRALITTGTLAQRVASLQARANWRDSLLKVEQIEVDHNWASLSLSGQLDFQGDWPLSATLTGEVVDLPWTPGLKGQKLSGSVSQSLLDLAFNLELSGQQQAVVEGGITLKDQRLPYSVSIRGEHLGWPFGDTPEYRFSELDIQSQGSLEQQSFNGEVQISALDYPSFHLTTQGSHGDGQLQLTQAQLQSDHGNAAVTGSLNYGDALTWQAQLTSQDLNLSALLPDLPLSLSGQLATQGHWQADDWHGEISNAKVVGSFEQQPFTLQGKLGVNHRWQVWGEQFVLSSRGSTVTLTGAASPDWSVNSHIQVEDASQWLPDLKGNLSGDIKVRGDTEQPEVQFDLEVADVAWQPVSLSSAKISGRYRPLNHHEFELSVDGQPWQVDSFGFTNLSLNASGDLSSQRIFIATDGDDDTPWGGEVHFNGRLSEQFAWWQGELTDGVIQTPLGAWEQQQNAPLTFSFAGQAFVMQQHCWQGPGASLCLPIPANLGTSGAARLSLDAQLEDSLAKILPEDIGISGQVSANIDASWTLGQLPKIQSQFHSDSGEIRYFGQRQDQAMVLPWQRMDLIGNMGKSGFEVGLELDNDHPLIRANFLLGPESPYSLAGELALNRLDLAPFTKAIPELEALNGIINANLQFDGDLNVPLVYGDTSLSDANLALLTNPTRLDDLSFDLNFQGQRLELESHAQVGGGESEIGGWLDWSQPQLALDFTIVGERLDVFAPPLVIAEVSPDLHLTKDDDGIKVAGRVDIPKASITLAQLPDGGVAVSDDVQFIDDRPQQEQAPPPPITLDLTLALGDDVLVSGNGVDGRLGGELSLTQKPTQVPQIFGDINLNDGSFSAFGQNLTIRRGRVGFTGPATLPTLDIEAIREIKSENVIAGVRVSGLATEPQLTLFSNPAMEQQEILSYITQGRGLGTGDNNSMLTMAALNLGLAQTGGIINTIGEGLGFNNVNVAPEGDGDDQQVAISGYLGEKIFLKYGFGIYEPNTEITIRYYLQSRLWLEGVNSTLRDTLDIYYSFDLE
ncbi:autotransporter assembly complex protein TamB [Ferrimonas aestuarii]|uniref:Translocation/assembly module TamB n=1 Tax=Ferrimonas aestuarii TaxID=2569539 RepID=A0A4U1BFF8_9GAMM|nr:translocation/assembly module TamB domain-containing protein [Ferrimonas aestuarii]TKB49653.1 translocation/assembly module TamB [Ferrimonas aestuarii]